MTARGRETLKERFLAAKPTGGPEERGNGQEISMDKRRSANLEQCRKEGKQGS